MVRGNFEFDAEYPFTDYWEKVSGEWVITLLSKPVNTSGSGILKYYVPNNKSGWGKADFDSAEIDFIESKRNKDLRIYIKIFENFSKLLGSGGVVALHVGKNRAVDMAATLKSFDFDSFKLVDHFIEDVSECEKHGIKDKGGTIEHQYLIYERL